MFSKYLKQFITKCHFGVFQEKELHYADLAEFRNNNTLGEKTIKPYPPTDYGEITQFQKQRQEENNLQNGHSKQDMQTGERVHITEKNEAGFGKTTYNNVEPTFDMEAISNDPDIKNNTYIPRVREWRTDDYLY